MDNHEAIIEKIKKAMRLARKAGTEGERAAAEAAAKRLADSHGIALNTVEVSEYEAKAVVKQGEEAKWVRTGKECHLASILIRKHFGVVVIQSFRKGSRKMRLDFVGTAINIDIAEYAYEIMWRESLRAWGQVHKELTKEYDSILRERGYYPERDRGGRIKRPTMMRKDAFMDGWFMKMDEKLTRNPLRNDTEQFAAEKKAAEEKFKNLNGIKENDVKRSQADKNATYRGYCMADKVNLSRPCEGSASETGMLGARYALPA